MKSKLAVLVFLLGAISLQAQELKSELLNGLKFRNIGPAFTSGRIADIAIHPVNQNIMYVAVGSGGVWKTTNAGVTWSPIFDGQASYSIGCVTIDPSNHNVIWVGTGENVGGRHVGFGDGVYRSNDGGKTWKNMGLKQSEHISKIIVHPDNSDVIWVAAQGPLWSSGGERGLYKSTDGGQTWKKTLGGNEWTGVTEIVIDPRNPQRLYAATWQRHRTVAALMGGGPGSGLHRSEDGGETWTELKNGIPNSNLGKTGLAINPFNPDMLYAALETDRSTGGLFISHDRGASWSKQSDMTSGGTGPHYYQELYADPHQEGRLYLMNNYVLISDDHGKTYRQMNEEEKHVDSHAIAWKKDDPNYLIVGTDGGLYESYDQTKTWRFIPNLPLTQYYKLAVDDTEPFYNVYGGTQDNGSHGGPIRTMFETGIRNSDWRNVLGADGHQSAVEPGNPDITYGEFQQGWLFRIDHKTGETVFVQPQPEEGDPHERFNWDAPILVSSFDPKRIYVASYRVWRSDNRGDAWTPISGDLTKNEERIALPIMGGQQSWDNAWDVGAMSNYNTITSLAESPKQDGLLYAGTDDGIIQVTEDGGSNWTKVDVGSIKGMPSTAFVNDIRADLYDAGTVYACLDNHKYGDFKPYMIKSTDKGKTWRVITGNLPDRLLIWRLVQDHVKKDLLFAATEFGIYFTVDGGTNWVQLKSGIPTISFRDITIQRRENDLVGASFGRGFYVLDDYSALRDLDASALSTEAKLFPTRKAFWYTEKDGLYGQGNSDYKAPNPEFGATFTYYLKDDLKSLKEVRKESEKKASESGTNLNFPGWDALEAERRQEQPHVILTVRDEDGKIVNTVKGGAKKGVNRATWNLKYASKDGIKLGEKSSGGGWFGGGFMATPGTYTVTLSKVVDGQVTDLSEAQSFEVVPLLEPALKGASYDEIAAFRAEFTSFQQNLKSTQVDLSRSFELVKALRKSLGRADERPEELVRLIYGVDQQLQDIDKRLNGDKTKNEIGERYDPTPGDGVMMGYMGLGGTYGPTENHKKAFARAQKQLEGIQTDLVPLQDKLEDLRGRVKDAGGVWIEGN